MSQYVLFYSKKCKYCVNFINILHKINARGYFSFVTVDRNPQTGQRNRFVNQYQVSQVPTIIVNDKKMVGAEAFQWLRSIIYDMGLKGPQSIDTRQNKDGSHINPQNFDKDEDQNQEENGLEGFDDTDNNYMSVESTANARIEYIPEDGETRRPSNNNINSQYQSILPADEARKLDIELLKTGRNTSDGSPKRRQGLKQDKLKNRQQDSAFEKYKRERDSEVVEPRRRM